jgi:hypothetical protein
MSDSQANDGESAFDVATESDRQVNELLAGTDGKICTMEYAGAIGYHINVARGETDPEFLWKIALLQALDETVFEMMYVDETHPEDARRQVERELERSFDPFTAERVAEVFEEKLTDLIETQAERAPQTEDGDA